MSVELDAMDACLNRPASKGLSIIVFHNLSMAVRDLTEEEHNRVVETTRKNPKLDYACDFWSSEWTRIP